MSLRILAGLVLAAALARAETLEQAVDGFVLNAEPKEQRWTITGSFGLTLTDGNSETLTVNAGIDAERSWDPWKLILKATALFSESDDVETANEQVFTERLERALSERAWLFQDLYFEHDEEESLTYRIIFTLGYRRQLVKKESFELFGEVGGGVLHEEFRTSSNTEGLAQLGVSWKWQITDQLLYTQKITIYPSLSEGGEFRLFWESKFTTPIGERLDLELSIIDRYNSDPPAGVEENDLQITLALVISFTPTEEE